MAVSQNDYNNGWTTLEGTLSEIMTDMQTDNIHPSLVKFIGYDAGNSKWAVIYVRG